MVDTPQLPTQPILPSRALRIPLPSVPLYAATLFVSALLLFWVQPLIAKMILPLLGGAPAVWNTAMMFFQLVLLAGYGYAHLLTRAVPPSRQAWIHGAVLVAAVTALPFAVGDEVPPTDAASPVVALWLVGRLFVILGLPFFALSASAPLLQSWFTRTGHPAAGDPYFLYGASNLGSLVALLAFPLLFEPLTTLSTQSRLWTGVFAVLVAMVVACAAAARRTPPRYGESPAVIAIRTGPAALWRARALWIALAFIPSSLLLGVTSYITTDVASAPLLWVIPLALYLLSFVVTFAHRPPIRASWSDRTGGERQHPPVPLHDPDAAAEPGDPGALPWLLLHRAGLSRNARGTASGGHAAHRILFLPVARRRVGRCFQRRPGADPVLLDL